MRSSLDGPVAVQTYDAAAAPRTSWWATDDAAFTAHWREEQARMARSRFGVTRAISPAAPAEVKTRLLPSVYRQPLTD